MIGVTVYTLDDGIYTLGYDDRQEADVRRDLEQQLADGRVVLRGEVETITLDARDIQRWTVKDLG